MDVITISCGFLEAKKPNIGALKIRIGCGGPLRKTKETPHNSIGNDYGPYMTS